MSGSGAPPVPAMVDAHAHVWLKDMPLVSNPRHRLDYDFSIEQYLQIPGEHGVDRAVLAAASPFGDYNDCTIASLRGRANLRGARFFATTRCSCIFRRSNRTHEVAATQFLMGDGGDKKQIC